MGILIYIVALLSALCIAMPVHEWAHAYVAYKQGDPTAKTYGRLTLAPFAHFDKWGFLCLLLFHFGWAKPVPVDSRNFKHGKLSDFLVSIAGICANLVTGTVFIIISCALNKFAPNYMYDWGYYGACLYTFLAFVIELNFVLAFFNLLPIYPLDGFRVVETFTKPNNGFVNFMKKYSNIILIILVLFTYFLDYYFLYTADGLINGLTWVFDKFFGLF